MGDFNRILRNDSQLKAFIETSLQPHYAINSFANFETAVYEGDAFFLIPLRRLFSIMGCMKV